MIVTITANVFLRLLNLVRPAFEYDSGDAEDEFFNYLEKELKEPVENIMKRIEHENEIRSRKTWNSNMFEYIVYWHDCDGAGYSESGVQYRGSDRMAAMKAKHYADEYCCGGSIDIRLLWKAESRGERISQVEEEIDMF